MSGRALRASPRSADGDLPWRRTIATILVIDDDEMFRRLLGKLIENAGHAPLAAADGPSGLAMAKYRKPDLVVTDMNMPGMTGWEIIRAFRADPAMAETPIVVVSAHQTAGDRDEAFQAGCSAYVAKTTDPETLIGRITEALVQD